MPKSTATSRRSRYPLDRAAEFQRTGWSEREVLEQARRDGYPVTRTLLRRWVRRGLLPPPRAKWGDGVT